MVEWVVVWNRDLLVTVKREWNVLHLSILLPAVSLTVRGRERERERGRVGGREGGGKGREGESIKSGGK